MAAILAGIDIAGNLLSIPGIGLVTVAGFLGEIGEPQNYEHWKQIQKLAGLNLSEQSSGKKNGQSKISKRGRAELRNLLYQASITLVAKNREFKTLYHYFLTRRENPLKKAGFNSHSRKITAGNVRPGQEERKLRPRQSIRRLSPRPITASSLKINPKHKVKSLGWGKP
jgi:hypothetical protein